MYFLLMYIMLIFSSCGDDGNEDWENGDKNIKRTLKGVHHWVSRKHPQRYVDSSAFRYNTKHLSECERFDVLLQNIGHRLRYSQLN